MLIGTWFCTRATHTHTHASYRLRIRFECSFAPVMDVKCKRYVTNSLSLLLLFRNAKRTQRVIVGDGTSFSYYFASVQFVWAAATTMTTLFVRPFVHRRTTTKFVYCKWLGCHWQNDNLSSQMKIKMKHDEFLFTIRFAGEEMLQFLGIGTYPPDCMNWTHMNNEHELAGAQMKQLTVVSPQQKQNRILSCAHMHALCTQAATAAGIDGEKKNETRRCVAHYKGENCVWSWCV